MNKVDIGFSGDLSLISLSSDTKIILVNSDHLCGSLEINISRVLPTLAGYSPELRRNALHAIVCISVSARHAMACPTADTGWYQIKREGVFFIECEASASHVDILDISTESTPLADLPGAFFVWRNGEKRYLRIRGKGDGPSAMVLEKEQWVGGVIALAGCGKRLKRSSFILHVASLSGDAALYVVIKSPKTEFFRSLLGGDAITTDGNWCVAKETGGGNDLINAGTGSIAMTDCVGADTFADGPGSDVVTADGLDTVGLDTGAATVTVTTCSTSIVGAEGTTVTAAGMHNLTFGGDVQASTIAGGGSGHVTIASDGGADTFADGAGSDVPEDGTGTVRLGTGPTTVTIDSAFIVDTASTTVTFAGTHNLTFGGGAQASTIIGSTGSYLISGRAGGGVQAAQVTKPLKYAGPLAAIAVDALDGCHKMHGAVADLDSVAPVALGNTHVRPHMHSTHAYAGARSVIEERPAYQHHPRRAQVTAPISVAKKHDDAARFERNQAVTQRASMLLETTASLVAANLIPPGNIIVGGVCLANTDDRAIHAGSAEHITSRGRVTSIECEVQSTQALQSSTAGKVSAFLWTLT